MRGYIKCILSVWSALRPVRIRRYETRWFTSWHIETKGKERKERKVLHIGCILLGVFGWDGVAYVCDGMEGMAHSIAHKMKGLLLHKRISISKSPFFIFGPWLLFYFRLCNAMWYYDTWKRNPTTTAQSTNYNTLYNTISFSSFILPPSSFLLPSHLSLLPKNTSKPHKQNPKTITITKLTHLDIFLLLTISLTFHP